MEIQALHRQAFVSREEELAQLQRVLEDAVGGKGSVVLISGEPGIGKTRLVEELRHRALSSNMGVLVGAAASTSSEPFLALSKALEGITAMPFFEEQEQASFSDLFAMDMNGALLAKASSDLGALDADGLAQTLSTVQDFIRDSFRNPGEPGSGLGRLEFGDMKIFTERGERLVLTAIFRGSEHPDMRRSLAQLVRQVEEACMTADGSQELSASKVKCIQGKMMKLLNLRFLVKRNLEGIKLETERNRIADGILTALAAKSEGKPLLVLLEDIHWADESSLFVLSFLARNVPARRIAIVCTARSGEGPALQRTLESMREDGAVTEINLGKFHENSVAEIIRAMYPQNTFSKEFVDGVAARCGGNPLFISELLKQMVTEGIIAGKNANPASASTAYSIPSTIGEIIDRRLETLDADAMNIAEYASCIGKEFTEDVVRSISIAREPAESIGKLLENGILMRTDGLFRFSHALFQDALYSGLSPKWRQVHHRSIGEHYERSFSGNLDAVIYELARHFSHTNEHSKASKYCEAAGQKAEGSFAAEQAIGFYETALKCLSKAAADQSRSSRGFEMNERLGDLYALVGSFDNSLTIFMAAAGAANSPEEEARALRKASRAHLGKGDYSKSLESLKEAEKALGGRVCLELGRIFIQQGNAYWKIGDYGNAIKMANAAMGTFEKFEGTDEDRAKVLHVVGTIHTIRGDYKDALDCYERSLELADKAEFLSGASATLNNMAIVYNNKGELDKALEVHERSLKIKERIGDKSGMAYSLNNIGVVFLDRGDTEKALKQFEPALEMWQSVGDKLGIATALYNIGNSYSDMGDFGKTLDYAYRSLEKREKLHDKRGVGLALSLISSAYLFLGETEKVLEYAERSLRIREELGDKKGIAGSLNNIGTAWSELGDVEKSLECLNRSLEMYNGIGDKNGISHSHLHIAEVYIKAGRMADALENAKQGVEAAIDTGAAGSEGTGRCIVGNILLLSGDLDNASKELDKAWRLLEGRNSRAEAAKLFYVHGLLWKAMNRKDEAKESLGRALSEFEQMGMKLWAEKSVKELAALQSSGLPT